MYEYYWRHDLKDSWAIQSGNILRHFQVLHKQDKINHFKACIIKKKKKKTHTKTKTKTKNKNKHLGTWHLAKTSSMCRIFRRVCTILSYVHFRNFTWKHKIQTVCGTCTDIQGRSPNPSPFWSWHGAQIGGIRGFPWSKIFRKYIYYLQNSLPFQI